MPPVLLAHLLWRGDATVALPRNRRTECQTVLKQRLTAASITGHGDTDRAARAMLYQSAALSMRRARAGQAAGKAVVR